MNITLDAHIDIPWVMTKHGELDLSVNNNGERSMTDFPRMREGGLNAAIFALYLSDAMQDRLGEQGSTEAIWKQIRYLNFAGGCALVRTTVEANAVIALGYIPIFLGLEGGRLINNDLTQLNALSHWGKIRYLTITHNKNTDWADSATDVSHHGGLTPFGVSVVQRCKELGILADVSHTSDGTARHILDISTEPVIASHSGCRDLLDHPRNLSNSLIRGIADTGGVICVPFAKRFVSRWYSVADHIDHIVQTVGINHVGIGSDLDGAIMCDGLGSVRDWKHVFFDKLQAKGYTDEQIAKVAGMNMLRVLG